ncbi:MAG: universal stress protein [Burkholderiales bacterium]
MAYKNILVHVDGDKHASARIDFAAMLALGWGAHLTGLHIAVPTRLPGFVQAELGPEFLEISRKADLVTIDKLATGFNNAMRRHGLVGSEWRTANGDPQDVFALHARYADLVVLGQHDPDDEGGMMAPAFPELVALSVGRPILILPYAGAFAPIPKRPLVCWKPSREATRAVTDALPFLQRAEKVSILAVNPRPGQDGHGEDPGADLALFLARHGVKAEVATQSGVKLDVGEFILSRAADLSADLLVMGAYAHPRLREVVFGGVTQTIMRHMTVPVLMSH